MKSGQYAFARLYGYMLGRRDRNTPAEACQDAVTPYVIVIGVPAGSAIMVCIAAIFPRLLSSKDWIPWVVIPSAIALYLISRPLRTYAATPEMAAPFRSRRSRVTTIICYVAVLLGSILIAGILSRLLTHSVASRQI
jgi:hypothetical protein